MGLPTVTDNLQGYEQGQLLNKVENIKNKMYYLIHGTLDDNVHYQQSLMLAKVLEQKDILFRQQVRALSPPTIHGNFGPSREFPTRTIIRTSRTLS